MAKLAVFRADASVEIGAGHVQRCLTLARVLAARGWEVGFAVSAQTPRAVPALDQSKFIQVIVEGSPESELAAMRRRWPDRADLLVVDHYGRDAAFEKNARSFARRVVAIDDLPSRAHDVDLLIDPTAGRTPADYRGFVPDAAKVLAGADYIMLRRDIVDEPRRESPAPERATRLLVAFGGTDPDDLTMRAMEALADARLAGIGATVVVGAGNPDAAAIAARASGQVRVLVDPPELPALMAEADLALAGSGTMAWELASFGVPSVLVVNSRGSVAQALSGAGAARLLGAAAAVTPASMAAALAALANDFAARTAMSAAGRKLVDGRGAQRVADAIEELMR